MIRRTAALSKDSRLSALATVLSLRQPAEEIVHNGTDVTADPFAPVIASIDAMITSLSTEEQKDLTDKEQCESDRMTRTQNAKMLSKKIDTNTETMDRLAAGILAAQKQIKEIEDQITELNAEQKAADEQRADELKEYTSAQADDNEAVRLLDSAKGVLEGFYKDNQLMLAQQPFTEAGVARPPPPSTWDTSYGGATGESNGIIAMMELIKQDIEKDIAKATTIENEAIAAHTKLSADIPATIGSLNSSKGQLNSKIGTDEGAKTREEGTRTTNQGDLTGALDFLKSIAPGCD